MEFSEGVMVLSLEYTKGLEFDAVLINDASSSVYDVNDELEITLEQKNKFRVGDTIEIMKPDGSNVFVTVLSIKDAEGNEMPSAPHPQQELHVTLSEPAAKYDLLRRSNKSE